MDRNLRRVKTIEEMRALLAGGPPECRALDGESVCELVEWKRVTGSATRLHPAASQLESARGGSEGLARARLPRACSRQP